MQNADAIQPASPQSKTTNFAGDVTLSQPMPHGAAAAGGPSKGHRLRGLQCRSGWKHLPDWAAELGDDAS